MAIRLPEEKGIGVHEDQLFKTKTTADGSLCPCGICGAEAKRSIGKDDAPAGAGWWWLGFMLPPVGLILWALCSDSMPQKAKKAGKGALASVIVAAILTVLYILLYFALVIWLVTGF